MFQSTPGSVKLIMCFILQLGAASRLQGITPAAVVNLLRYVHHMGQKDRVAHQNKHEQKEEREEELCARNASLPQWTVSKNLFIPENVQNV